MPARTRKPRHLLKGAAAPLDGAAALIKRAADRLNAASAYAGDGASGTAYRRYISAMQLLNLAALELEHIARTHVREEQ